MEIYADVLVAEIGSTTTVINAFQNLSEENPVFLGQGQAPTTVLDGDVTIGLSRALDSLKETLGIRELHYGKMMASSSAAGGLKMTVHGLVYDMTAKAAREAALGAGGIIHAVTAGRLRQSDLNRILAVRPNLILIAGGLDFGERDTALYNCEKICSLRTGIPVIYGGNIENHEEVAEIFKCYNSSLYIAPNVYPKVDQLNVEPTRKIIQSAFEEHIVKAPGMEKVRELVSGAILPTPGAVMKMAKLLKEELGDLVVLDVGGATTDVHSVTKGSEAVSRILLAPEPEAKRTVEGDLGMFINMPHVVERVGIEKLEKELGFDINIIMETMEAIPKNEQQVRFVERLCLEATATAMERHAGRIRKLYGESGFGSVAEGKDLTEVQVMIGTGGALTRLPSRYEILKKTLLCGRGEELFPSKEVKVMVDEDYIMASLGVLSTEYPEAAMRLMKNSLFR